MGVQLQDSRYRWNLEAFGPAGAGMLVAALLIQIPCMILVALAVPCIASNKPALNAIGIAMLETAALLVVFMVLRGWSAAIEGRGFRSARDRHGYT